MFLKEERRESACLLLKKRATETKQSCYEGGGYCSEILLPRIARQGTVWLISIRG